MTRIGGPIKCPHCPKVFRSQRGYNNHQDMHTGYSVRKQGDNYALCFRGLVVESGIFATRETANKHKRIAERERRAR